MARALKKLRYYRVVIVDDIGYVQPRVELNLPSYRLEQAKKGKKG